MKCVCLVKESVSQGCLYGFWLTCLIQWPFLNYDPYTFKYTNFSWNLCLLSVSWVSCFSLWLPCLSHSSTPLSRLVFTYPHTYRALSSASFPNSPLRKTTSTPFFYHHPLIILSVAYSINPSLTRPSPDCDALLPEVPNSSSNTLQLIHTFSFFPFSALDNKTVGIIYHAKIFKILSCSK